MKASDLTKGERLLLERRRNEESQAAAAERLGVTTYRFRQWEADEAEGAPRVAVGRIEAFEECFLLRRRAGVSAADMAELVGCSREWLKRMERGREPADRLVETWETAGSKLAR